MGDYAGPYGSAPTTSEDTISSPTEATDAAPAVDDTAPAVTPMGDVGFPAEPSHAPAQSNTRTSSTTSNDEDDEPAYEGPTYTPMGDVAAPGTESYTAPETTTTTTTTETPGAYTPMGDYGGPYDAPAATDETETETAPGRRRGHDARVRRPGLHTDGRRGDAGAESTVPAGPAPTYTATTAGRSSLTGSWLGGGTVGLARDGKNTAFTIGIAEGFGLFGSAGEADAPEESSFQSAARAASARSGSRSRRARRGSRGSSTARST